MLHLVGTLSSPLNTSEKEDLERLYRLRYGDDWRWLEDARGHAMPWQNVFVTYADDERFGAAKRRIVGVATLCELTLLSGPTGYITDVIVLPAFHGQGRSHALVREITLVARARKYATLRTSIPDLNEFTDGLVEHLGFTRLDSHTYVLAL